MVKTPNRPPTPIRRREPVGPPAPPDACPDIQAQITLDGDVPVQVGDPVSVQVRDGRVRVDIRGQVVGWITDRGIVDGIEACQAAGGAYVGQLTSLEGRTAVIALAGRRQ